MLSLLYIGIDLELKCDPVPNSPSQYSLENEIEHAAWLKQINRLKHIGAVRRLEPEELSTAVFAPMFVVPKKDSPEFRCIYDMRYLNKYIKYKHFKLEGLPVVRDLLRRNDFMTKVDLQDAYLHCAIKQAHQRYLAFVDDNEEFWCFLVLPFGLTSAPRWFTKIMKEVMGFFRRCGIRLTIYFDDIVIFTEVVNGDFEAARTKARETHEYVVQVLRKLGWLISEKKNFPEPTHVLEILGLTINSHTMTISAPPKKVKKLKQKALKLLRTGESTPRELASFLGYLNSLSQALLPERLRTRALHMDKNNALSEGLGWDDPLKLSLDACLELTFWCEQVQKFNGKSWVVKPNFLSVSDASTHGFGATCQNLIFYDQWSEEEAKRHSSQLEMDAAVRAIRHFVLKKGAKNTQWLHKSDSSTVVAYLNKQGGKKPELNQMAEDLWEFCLERKIQLRSEHIPGEQNSEADRLSRLAGHKTEWGLHPQIFAQLDKIWGPHNTDLFAARENTQLVRYFSLYPDPMAVGTDALLYKWTDLRGFAYPPFGLLGRVLAKVRREQATITLVAPLWMKAPWFPDLLDLVVKMPLKLIGTEVVVPPTGMTVTEAESKLAKWNLFAWQVSGSSSVRKVSQLQLLKESARLGRTQMVSMLLGRAGHLSVN